MSQKFSSFNTKSNQINVSQNNNIIRKINVNQTNNINFDNLNKTEKPSLLINNFGHKRKNNEYDFNFKGAKWSLTIIYLISFIGFPIFYSLIKTYALTVVNNKIDICFFYFVPILGLLISLSIDWKFMIKKGGWAAYSHLIFGLIGAIFFVIFFKFFIIINLTSNGIMLLVVQSFRLLGSVLVLIFSKSLYKSIIATLKTKKLNIMIWVTIMISIAFILITIIAFIPFFKQTNDSKNQEQLNKLMKTPLDIIILVLTTIFIAPITEEISYRYGTFIIVGNRWLGFIISLIYFPAIHVMYSGDWDKIGNYVMAGVLLSLLFMIKQGNVTYTIAMHALWNMIALLLGFLL